MNKYEKYLLSRQLNKIKYKFIRIKAGKFNGFKIDGSLYKVIYRV